MPIFTTITTMMRALMMRSLHERCCAMINEEKFLLFRKKPRILCVSYVIIIQLYVLVAFFPVYFPLFGGNETICSREYVFCLYCIRVYIDDDTGNTVYVQYYNYKDGVFQRRKLGK